MKLSKIDLSSIRAISHDEQTLGLVIDRGDSLDVVEVPAPIAAYEGLQLLDAIATAADSDFIDTIDFNQLSGVNPVFRLPVRSTMADAIGYNPYHNLLQIEFKNGSVYEYEDVDEHTWHDLQNSDSVGEFFNHEIKGNYRSRRIQ